jgi:MFS family permease
LPKDHLALPAPSVIPSGQAQFLKLFPSIMLPIFLAVVDQTIVATALPAIAEFLGGVDKISWVIITYLVAVTIAAPVYGRLGDVLGRRKLLIVALVITMVGSIACSVATSMETLILARILQGLGGGGLMTLSQALVGEAVPPRDRARYQGYLAAVAVTSNAFGPVVGGILTQHLGWRSIFLINLPLAALAVVLAFRLPPRSGTGQKFRFDGVGLALFIVFISSALVMLQQVQMLNFGILDTGLALVMICSAGIFGWWEGRAPHPLLPLQILKNPSIWRCDAIAACHGGMLVSLITYTPIYLRVVHGTSLSETGLLLLPMTVGIGLGSLITGRIVGRTGYTAALPSWGLIGAAMTLIVLAAYSPDMTGAGIAITLGATALFMGTVMGVVQVTVQTAAGATLLGTAAGTVQFSRALGAALGTATVGTVLFLALRIANPDSAEVLGIILRLGPGMMKTSNLANIESYPSQMASAFRFGYLTIACFACIASALAWTIPIRRI